MTQEPGHRARDPGVKLGQVGRALWVHCPECDGAAKSDGYGVTCAHCGYMTIQQTKPRYERWGRIRLNHPNCTFCGGALPTEAMPSARGEGRDMTIRIRCPHCGKTVDYPATWAFSPGQWPEPRRVRRYLVAQVGGETLWVDNLAHLDMLEEYLGAKVRERGPVAGLTMMARLPAWMKSATMRPKIVKALQQLRDRAEKAGIDE